MRAEGDDVALQDRYLFREASTQSTVGQISSPPPPGRTESGPVRGHIGAWPMYVLVIPLLLWTGGLLRWYFRQQGGPRTPGRGRSLISVWQVSAVMVLLSMASKSSSRKAIRALLNRGRRQWPPHDGHLVCSGSSRNEGRRIVCEICKNRSFH